MKKTMKYLSMAALALVGAVMTGCSNDDDNIVDNNKNKVITLTTTVGMKSNDTRALTSGGVKTFADGDKLAIFYKQNGSESTVKAESSALTRITDNTAKFTFVLDNPDMSKNITYVYPAAMANDDGTINNEALYKDQDGTLTTLARNFDLATYTGPWDGDQLPTGVELENQLSILACKLKYNEVDITNTITSMTINGTYTITPSSLDRIYVAIHPVSGATINITATNGTNNYTKELTGKTYAAGTGHNVSWIMTKQ